MYTTIKLLKEQSACRDGFSRVLAFFGGRGRNPEQPIPLHALGLVVGLENLYWVLENACVIDPSQFEEVRNRYALNVFWVLYFQNSSIDNDLYKALESTGIVKISEDGKRSRSQRQKKTTETELKEKKLSSTHNILISRVYDIKTSRQLEAFLTECRMYSFNSRIWNEVINHRCWNHPAEFLEILLKYHKLCVKSGYSWRAVPANLADRFLHSRVKVNLSPPIPVPESEYEDDEEDDDDDDDDGRSADEVLTKPLFPSLPGISLGTIEHAMSLLNPDVYGWVPNIPSRASERISYDPVGKTATIRMKNSDDINRQMFNLLVATSRGEKIANSDEDGALSGITQNDRILLLREEEVLSTQNSGVQRQETTSSRIQEDSIPPRVLDGETQGGNGNSLSA